MAYDDIIHFFLLERPDHRWAFVIGAPLPPLPPPAPSFPALRPLA